eukprot:TRINITY_DN40953_c0_g1_i1.p1 TRINITY_DN40953_c0_g1~~TRINITY_DN40953_c0_g1_i1.p1  ORF type:complete len:213 (+),score=53.68 TRINITY_DN40953_c0_g1_i1:90-728(+)
MVQHLDVLKGEEVKVPATFRPRSFADDMLLQTTCHRHRGRMAMRQAKQKEAAMVSEKQLRDFVQEVRSLKVAGSPSDDVARTAKEPQVLSAGGGAAPDAAASKADAPKSAVAASPVAVPATAVGGSGADAAAAAAGASAAAPADAEAAPAVDAGVLAKAPSASTQAEASRQKKLRSLAWRVGYLPVVKECASDVGETCGREEQDLGMAQERS